MAKIFPFSFETFSLSLSFSLLCRLLLLLLVAANLPAPENHLHLHPLPPVPRQPDPHFVPGPPLVQGVEEVSLRLDLFAVERGDDVAQDEPPPVVPGGAPDARGGGGRPWGHVEDQDARLSDLAEGLRGGDGDLERERRGFFDRKEKW